MTKPKKLKVMQLESAPSEITTIESVPEGLEHKSKSNREPRNGEMLEKALQALRDLRR